MDRGQIGWFGGMGIIAVAIFVRFGSKADISLGDAASAVTTVTAIPCKRRCISVLKIRRLVVPTGTIPFFLKGFGVRAVGHTPILRYRFSYVEFDRLISPHSKKCLPFGNGLSCEIA
jgi:hypothetical protein